MTSWASRLSRGWAHLSEKHIRPHHDGISFSEEWLQGKLKQALDSDNLTIDSLSLLSKDSTIHLTVKSPVAAHVTLCLNVLPINWQERTIPIQFHAEGIALSDSVIKRTLSTLLLSVLEGSVGHKVLESLTANLDYLESKHDILTIHLDKIPVVHKWMHYSLLGYSVADNLALKSILTMPGRIRLYLGRNHAAAPPTPESTEHTP